MQKQTTSFSTTVLIALLGVLWTSRLSAEEQVLFDFDQKTLSVDWSAVGKISATRKDAPAFEPREGKQPGGKGITVTTEGKAGLYAKTGRVPDDWDGFDEVSFWIHRSEEEARERAKSVLEVQVYESDMKARFWHRVEVDHKGWKQVSLPLRWFRWGDKGRVPRWNAIDRFGFWFRDGAVCSIDMVFVKTSKTERAAYFDVEQLSGVAFSPADDVKILENQEFAVLSNAPLIQMEELDEHLRAVMSAVVKDLPFIESPSRTPILLIFETREEYRGFTPRFARQLNSNAIPPSTHGYTIHGVSTSYWSKEHGTIRPVYTHEFLHSFLGATERISSRGGWLQEGLASRFQARFHPHDDLSKVVSTGLERGADRSPLKELCNGDSISTSRYWQAMTVVDLLLANDGYRERLPALFKSFKESGSTNLDAQLEKVLETNWKDFEADWRRHCKKHYVAAPRR